MSKNPMLLRCLLIVLQMRNMMKNAENTVYGSIALVAVRAVIDSGVSPNTAWDTAVQGKEKSCPRGAFLGLCQDGWIKGVPSGNYLRQGNLNQQYAIRAAQYLLAKPGINVGAKELWQEAIKTAQNRDKIHNQQMNVVIALNDAGLLQQGVDLT
ncbi:DUF6979 family protein [Serratia sp. AKBS12]|uniref:DUF6979 family protein n=1 Tax=Serratia sp. AKBS12 TaxID=2974597 RepID=UPI00216625F3|nr:hypothetical protein [Serratia sp. AKBS12]MCS3408996.1 hypothetical protein [Serratia sp. AKBS12]